MTRILVFVALSIALPMYVLGQAPDSKTNFNQQSSAARAIEEATRGYTVTLRTGTAEAVAEWYTSEGELLLPGLAALHGRAAIRAFLAPLASATAVESVEMKSDLLEVHGSSADSWGTYRQVAGEKGKPKQTFRGRYAALWHFESDRRWRLVRLMMQPLPSD
jgi:ketosteroid isomerase-like protein